MSEISYQKMVWVLLPVLVMNYFFSFMGSLPVAEVEPVLLELGDLGSLKGKVLKSAFNNKVISSFRGIPFAKPPIKDLRFQDPEPYGAWEGELDATEFASCCVQGKSSGSEDCLYLNVYTVPKATGLPVMVFLHGGGFTNGCSSPYGPEYLLDREDVILVTVNYRLGVFGFISTEDEVAPGNYGLMDQNLALRWINSYITYFGGDPARVTLFGQSAGAYAVHHHVLSPLSAGLIERAILESGTSLNARALIEGGRATLSKHAKLLNYTGSLDDSKKLMKFMASKTTDQLIQTQMKLPSLAGTPISYGPRVDSERAEPFLPEHPIALIQNRNETIPIMAGVNQDEGALTAAALLASHSKNLNLLIDEYKKYLPDMLEFHATSNDTSTLADKIWQQYIGTTDRNRMDRNLYRKVSQMMGDGLYYLGFVRTMDILPDPVHLYFLTKKPVKNIVSIRYPNEGNVLNRLGASHNDELFYLFPDPNLELYKDNSDEGRMSFAVVDYFTSFAKGVPKWPASTNIDRKYMEFKLPGPELMKERPPFEKRIEFWKQLIAEGDTF